MSADWRLAAIQTSQHAKIRGMILDARLPSKPLWEGGALRIAPSLQGKPAAFFWKFWISGSEVYATARSAGNHTRISVHESGQIHVHLEGKDLHHLPPPLVMGNGKWLHAFELRFLLSPGMHHPPAEDIKKKPAFLIEVPAGAALILNLFIGNTGYQGLTELPHEVLPGANVLWRATLKNQRSLLLVARMMEMDQKNKDEIEFVRRELCPRLSLEEAPKKMPYIEVKRVTASAAGGNILLVVPMGAEAIRVDGPSPGNSIVDGIGGSRNIVVSTPSVSGIIIAPNGATVGNVTIVGEANQLVLKKGIRVQGRLGTITLSTYPEELIAGASFRTKQVLCSSPPTVDGAAPRAWVYSIMPYFEREELRVEVRQLSTALRHANFDGPVMPNIGPNEEVIMVAPMDELVLRATRTRPQVTAVLEGSLLLRDI